MAGYVPKKTKIAHLIENGWTDIDKIAEEVGSKRNYVARIMRGGRTGRNKAAVDWETVDTALGILCSGEEAAALANVSYDTLEKRCKEEFDMALTDYIKEKQTGGRECLRRAQYKLAIGQGKAEKVMSNGKKVEHQLGPNPSMLIWLGKQHLGQQDTVEFEDTGGGATSIRVMGLDNE